MTNSGNLVHNVHNTARSAKSKDARAGFLFCGYKMDLVIEPIVSKNTQLDELLAEITPDNIYAEEGFGDLVGREIL